MIVRDATARVTHARSFCSTGPTGPTEPRCSMLEARIVSPRGPLYIAADATPYDVQQLRSHVRALRTGHRGDARLALHLGPETRARVASLVAALAARLADEGVVVSVDDEQGGGDTAA